MIIIKDLNFTDEPVKTSCSSFKFIAFYLLTVFISCITLNSINLWILHKVKLMTPVNCFMVTLFCLNIIAGCVELPVLIYNSFNCGFIKLFILKILNPRLIY